jgi:hypothetical protein
MAEFNREEPFELPVNYRGQEIILPGKLVQMGYTYKLFVEVLGQTIILEPDEERNFRVVSEDPAMKALPMEMLQAILASLEENLR